jgi:phage-related protein
MYTNKKNPANVSSVTGEPAHKEAEIHWEGDSHAVIKGFPAGPRQTLGHYLRLAQKGEKPPDSSPVPGLDDVFELRDDDDRAWYRVLYLKRIGDTIYVLHCFEKQSNQIEKRDIRTAQTRLTAVRRRLREGRIHAKSNSTRNERKRAR